jgi:ABC-2 type transport system ATP-binding protein
MVPALEIKGLRKEYNGFFLKDISFSLPQGYVMGLIGPNGAGKTTIIKLILNLIKKKAGEIRVFGMDNLKQEIEMKSRIGFIHEVPSFYGYMKLERVKSIVSRFYPAWDDKLFSRLCGEFKLPLGKKISSLSRGMNTKFALALALSHDADLLLMDEPTSGLDPVFRRELMERLSEIIQDEQKAVLFSTHITSDLERTADYITYIQGGEIIFSSTKDKVREDWAIVKGENELLTDEIRPLFKGIRKSQYGFKALTSDIEKVRRQLRGQNLIVEKASLDEIMFFLSKGEINA